MDISILHKPFLEIGAVQCNPTDFERAPAQSNPSWDHTISAQSTKDYIDLHALGMAEMCSFFLFHKKRQANLQII